MDREQPTWGLAQPCCALCGRALDRDRSCWVVLDQGLGFGVCADLEECESLRRLVRAHPERFTLGAGWPSRERPLRLWPARVRAIERAASFDESCPWRLQLDVRVTTVGGQSQRRGFVYTFPGSTGDPRTAAVFRAVLGREPLVDESVEDANWIGRRCGVVLDWSRDERGRQVVWVAELRMIATGRDPSSANNQGGISGKRIAE